MPLTDTEFHKLLTDIAELKSDIKYIRENLLEISLRGREREMRLQSLETSRTYAKGTLTATWAALLWIGWDWVQSIFRGYP